MIFLIIGWYIMAFLYGMLFGRWLTLKEIKNMKLKAGDRVKVKMDDVNGDPLYGTVIDGNFLGIAALIECDTPIDKRYFYDKQVMIIKDHLEKLPNEDKQ